MSAKRVPTGFAIALALGIADLFFINLYVSPKVFASRSDGDAVVRGSSPGQQVSPQPDQPDEPAGPDSTAPPVEQPGVTDDPEPGTEPDVQPDDLAEDPADDPDDDPADDDPADDDPADDDPAGDPTIEPAADFKPTMHRIYFHQNRATIKAKHRKVLDSAITQLKDYPAAVAVVEAWADASEKRYGLHFLVKRRSNKIADYLQENGIAEDRIRTVNHGIGKSEDKFVNRRVRLRVELP